MPKSKLARLEAITSSKDVTDVYAKVMKTLFGNYHTHILSVADLICLIIDKCSGMFHPLPDEGDDMLDFLDVFAVDLASW
jgi:hypothetical protein